VNRALLTIVAMLAITPAMAQDTTDLVYSIEASASVSPIVSMFQEPRYPGATDELSYGYGGFVQVQWRPGRLVAFGIMTGWAFLAHDELPSNPTIDDEGPVTASATLTAIPLQVFVSMRSEHFKAGLGMGPYLMMSQLESDDVSKGSRFELGLTFVSSYVFPISSTLKIGPELRVLYLDYRGILSIMPSVVLTSTLYEY